MKLTNKNVEQLTTNTKSYIVWDTDVRGFGVRVNLNAKKTFILKYRVGFGRSAKVRKPVIGTAGIMKVEEARRIARKWLSGKTYLFPIFCIIFIDMKEITIDSNIWTLLKKDIGKHLDGNGNQITILIQKRRVEKIRNVCPELFDTNKESLSFFE